MLIPILLRRLSKIMSNTFENDYYKFQSNVDTDNLPDISRTSESILVDKHEIIICKNKNGKIIMSDKYMNEGYEFRKCIITTKGLFVTMFNNTTRAMKSFNLNDIIVITKNGWQLK